MLFISHSSCKAAFVFIMPPMNKIINIDHDNCRKTLRSHFPMIVEVYFATKQYNFKNIKLLILAPRSLLKVIKSLTRMPCLWTINQEVVPQSLLVQIAIIKADLASIKKMGNRNSITRTILIVVILAIGARR